METLLLTGLIVGLLAGILGTLYFSGERRKLKIKDQSVVMLDRIKQVCKLISVEGEFSEIFTHRDGKGILFNLVQLEKKAIIIIQARVFVGFDLAKLNIWTESGKRIIHIEKFPEPGILSIETDLEYYDIKKGVISKFSEEDLNNLNKKAKEIIRDKALHSHLIDHARKQAEETIYTIKRLIEPSGWKLQQGGNASIPESGTTKKMELN